MKRSKRKRIEKEREEEGEGRVRGEKRIGGRGISVKCAKGSKRVRVEKETGRKRT